MARRKRKAKWNRKEKIFLIILVFFLGFFFPHENNYVINEKILSSHHTIDFEKEGTDVTIKDIDYVGDIFGESHSMFPTIDVGNLVLMQEYDKYREKYELKTGDIIRYHCSPYYPIIHRIIEIEDDYIITKGDNNKFVERVPYECVTDIIMGVFYR